jgi:hypothetical protein
MGFAEVASPRFSVPTYAFAIWFLHPREGDSQENGREQPLTGLCICIRWVEPPAQKRLESCSAQFGFDCVCFACELVPAAKLVRGMPHRVSQSPLMHSPFGFCTLERATPKETGEALPMQRIAVHTKSSPTLRFEGVLAVLVMGRTSMVTWRPWKWKACDKMCTCAGLLGGEGWPSGLSV